MAGSLDGGEWLWASSTSQQVCMQVLEIKGIYTFSPLDLSTHSDNFINILLPESFQDDNAISLYGNDISS